MKRVFALCALCGALALFGCGGGSSSSSLSGGKSVSVLITDSFNDTFAHVWATIYHVEIVPQTGANIVLFDSSAGVQIDLKTLRDATGARFSFLGNATIPAGTYTGIKVTVGSTMQLFQNGVAVGSPVPVDASIPTDSSGRPVLALTFANPKTINANGTSLVIDFDLAHFILKDSKVLPALLEGSQTGIGDPNRHNPAPYHGTVSGLTGTSPVLAFTLTPPGGAAITVTTSAATSVYGAQTLANGEQADVWGTYDATTMTLVATQLNVDGMNAPPAPMITGTASNINATAGTFSLAPQQACIMTPVQTSVNVVTAASTVYHADNGSVLTESAFFTALATTPTVIAQGTYDPTSNTFTATMVNIVDHTQDGGWNPPGNPFRDGGGGGGWGNGIAPPPPGRN